MDGRAKSTVRRLKGRSLSVRHPGCRVGIVFKARRALQRVLGGVHHKPPLLILHSRMDSLERYRNILFAGPEEAPHGHYQGNDLTGYRPKRP
jgi:hypothetical protein